MVSDALRIGFIGLGNMGSALVRELAKLEAPLVVYDVRREAAAAFGDRAAVATGIGEVGRLANVVGICVQDDKQIEQCAEELLPALAQGSIILIHSTVSPAVAITIGDAAARRGVIVLDAPVTRTVYGDDGPFVFCMLGGSAAAVARIRPLLDAYATDTVHVGALGSALALKICNNLAAWCSIKLAMETAQLAEAAGVPRDMLWAVTTRNGVLSPPGRSMVELSENPEAATRKLLATQAVIGEKDLSLAQALAARYGVDVPMAALVRSSIGPTLLAMAAAES